MNILTLGNLIFADNYLFARLTAYTDLHKLFDNCRVTSTKGRGTSIP